MLRIGGVLGRRRAIWSRFRWPEAYGLWGAFLGGGLGAKSGKSFDARYEIKAQGVGSNFGNVKIQRRPYQAKLGKKFRLIKFLFARYENSESKLESEVGKQNSYQE